MITWGDSFVLHYSYASGSCRLPSNGLHPLQLHQRYSQVACISDGTPPTKSPSTTWKKLKTSKSTRKNEKEVQPHAWSVVCPPKVNKRFIKAPLICAFYLLTGLMGWDYNCWCRSLELQLDWWGGSWDEDTHQWCLKVMGTGHPDMWPVSLPLVCV